MERTRTEQLRLEAELYARLRRIRDARKAVVYGLRAAREAFGIEGVVRFFFRPSLYLDEAKIAAAGLDRVEVEQTVARALSESDGVALAVPRSGPGPLEDTAALERVRRSFHPSRSGDIYVAQEPYWFLFDKGPVAVMHGSPWRYDTHVPIVFAGPGIPTRRVHRHVQPGALLLGQLRPGGHPLFGT